GRAAMDGYVCHEVDTGAASPAHPVRLRVSGEVRMGEAPGEGPDPGEAWSITTGGAMPLRGDRVVPLEWVRRYGDELVMERPAEAKRHISEPGEDLPLGAPVLYAGKVISAAAVAALAGAGIRDVSVHRRPRIALLSTGDELVEARDGADAPSGRIFNSNAYALTGELESIGGLVDYRGIVPDRPEALRESFKEAAGVSYDVVLSTGGVSVGPHDKVPRTWLDLGVKRIIGRIDLKPGGPFFAGLVGSMWVIGLSGSPAARRVKSSRSPARPAGGSSGVRRSAGEPGTTGRWDRGKLRRGKDDGDQRTAASLERRRRARHHRKACGAWIQHRP